MSWDAKSDFENCAHCNPDQTVWDSTVAGFGARRQRSEAVSYLLIYRTQEGAAAMAHNRAARITVDPGNRPCRGATPSRAHCGWC